MTVLRLVGRSFAGILLFAGLSGVGLGTYHWVRLRPRCIINTATHDLRAYCYDPEFMITASGHIPDDEGRREKLKTPLLVWNTHSGAIERKLLNDVSSVDYLVFSKDHQFCMAYLGNGNSRLVEWRSGKEWGIATGVPEEHRSFQFSPRGDWFYVYDAAHKQPHLLVDVAQREPAVRLDGDNHPAHGFSPDGGQFYFWKDTCLQAWNTRTRRIDGSFAVQPPVSFDESGRRLAVYSADGTEILVWDAVGFRQLAQIRPAAPRAFAVAHKDTQVAGEDADRKLNRDQRVLVFSPSGNVLATHPHSQQEFKRNSVLEFWETDSGRKRSSFPLQTKIYGSFTSDASFLLQDATIDSFNRFRFSMNGHYQLLDTATARIRWVDSLPVGKLSPLSDSVLIRLDKSDCWEMLDATTGETLARTPHPFKAEFRAAHSGRHERYLCLFGQSRPPDFPAIVESWLARWIKAAGAVQVIDKETGQVVYERRIDAEEFAHVSGDGATLITFAIIPGEDSGAGNGPVQTSRTYQYAFYDLHSAKPWFWALAVPTGIVILALLWRRWRSGRAKRASPVMPAPAGG